jgi:hypothetical protein
MQCDPQGPKRTGSRVLRQLQLKYSLEMVTTNPSEIRSVDLAGPHRFTREAYHNMAAAGILTEDDRVELIAGEIIDQMPIGPTRAATVKRLNQMLSRVVGDRCIVSVQDPVALDDFIDQSHPDRTQSSRLLALAFPQ